MRSRLSVRERVQQEVKNVEDLVKALVESKFEDLESRMNKRIDEMRTLMEEQIRKHHDDICKNINANVRKMNEWMSARTLKEKRLDEKLTSMKWRTEKLGTEIEKKMKKIETFQTETFQTERRMLPVPSLTNAKQEKA